MDSKLKDIIWQGDSYDVVCGFSKAVRRQVGHDLYLLQLGEMPRSWKPMKTVGATVKEIRVRDQRNQFRVIYLVKRADGIHVLHAFQKKGQKTRQGDIDIAKDRLKKI